MEPFHYKAEDTSQENTQMELVLGMILISCLDVYTIWKSVILLHKEIKYNQSAEILKGLVGFCILAVCFGVVYWFGSMIYNIFKISESISYKQIRLYYASWERWLNPIRSSFATAAAPYFH